MRLPIEEVDDVAALRSSWKKLCNCAAALNLDLHQMQVGYTVPSACLLCLRQSPTLLKCSYVAVALC